MRDRKPIAALVSALAAFSWTLAVAQDLKPALRAETAFLTPGGGALDSIAPDQPFVIRATISSDLSSEPPAGLNLFAWLRRIDAGDLPCGQAAETFMRTGRLPIGTVFLNDPVIGTLTEDRAFIVSDPDFSLATANIVGATTLDSMPASLVSDPVGRRFLMALPDEGAALSIDATGTLGTRFEGLSRPIQALPAGIQDALVLQENGEVMLARASGGSQAIAAGVSALRPAAGPGWVAALMVDSVGLINAAEGRVSAILPINGPRDTALLAEIGSERPFAVATLTGGAVAIHYLDDPDHLIRIVLPHEASRLAADPSGRVALAWAPAGGPVQVIDIARGYLARQINPPGPVSEIAFSDRSAFLMLESQTHVGALDLRAVARAEKAEFREIQIGTTSPPADHARQLLASLWPMEGMLAVHAETYQGYRIMDGSVMGDAPAMTATSLRGGLPRLVATLDRSFREDAPGLFEGMATLPGPGRFELVATTGLGSLSFCAEVPVAQPDDGGDAGFGTLTARPEGDAIRLMVKGADGRPAADMSGRLSFTTLSGSWRAQADIRTDGQGLSRLAYVLPDLAAIVVRIDAPSHQPFAPLLIERENP